MSEARRPLRQFGEVDGLIWTLSMRDTQRDAARRRMTINALVADVQTFSRAIE